MKIKSNKIAAVLLLGIFTFSNALFADDSQLINMVKELQGQMRSMQQTIDMQNAKISRLEQSREIPSAPTSSGSVDNAGTPPMSEYEFNERLSNATGGANKWLKDLKFSGDLRLRYEGQQFTSGNPSETDDRNRFRYRLRYGFEKTFNPEMKIGFAMASGEQVSGTQVDPTSTNTSFDNNFNFKDIFIEKAYATYTPNWAKIGPVEKVEITGGKFTNPFEAGSSDMIWDRDVKPEGAAEKINFNFYDGEEVDLKGFFTMGQFILDEDAATGGDSEMYAYQLGINPVLYTPMFDRPVDLLSAVSLYQYHDYAVKNNFLIPGTTGGTSLARGNTAVCGTQLCAGDFTVWEAYNEIAFYPGGFPIRPFFDFATNIDNQAVNDEGQAWGYGVKIGKMVKKGDWEIASAYKRIESDSVVGAFNDSDFGNGHSGKRGIGTKLSYMMTDSITLGAAGYFVNNTATGTNSVRDEEQRRFQLDLIWKF